MRDEKNQVVFKQDIHRPRQIILKLKTHPTNAKIIDLFSFHFMELNNDVNDASLMPNYKKNFRPGLSHIPRVV